MAVNNQDLQAAEYSMRRHTKEIEHQSERILECYQPEKPVDQAENLRVRMGEKTPHDHLIQGAAREIVDRKLIALAREILQAVNNNKRTTLPQEIKDYIKRTANVQL